MTIDRIGNVSKISKRILTFLTLQLPAHILRKKIVAGIQENSKYVPSRSKFAYFLTNRYVIKL